MNQKRVTTPSESGTVVYDRQASPSRAWRQRTAESWGGRSVEECTGWLAEKVCDQGRLVTRFLMGFFQSPFRKFIGSLALWLKWAPGFRTALHKGQSSWRNGFSPRHGRFREARRKFFSFFNKKIKLHPDLEKSLEKLAKIGMGGIFINHFRVIGFAGSDSAEGRFGKAPARGRGFIRRHRFKSAALLCGPLLTT